jgi:diguanylate cyclase (GGDEF)-like protein
MTSIEIALWSGCIGVFVACCAASIINSLVTRSAAGAQAAGFVAAAALFVWTLSGLQAQFVPGTPPAVLRTMVLLTGPLAALVSNMGLMVFLRAYRRDGIVRYGMMFVSAMTLAAMLSALWPDYRQALEWVAMTIIVCSAIAFWLILRAALLGDRFAWPMAVASIAILVAVMVLYAVALGVAENHTGVQALGAAAAAAHILGSVIALSMRNTEYLRMRRALSMHREKDLLTQLWTGAALIKRIEQTVARAARNRKETAIICVEIFNAVELRQELGNNALEQVIYGIAARIRHSVGASTEVGRYDDASFVVIIETVKQPSVLRTIAMGLSSAVRKPYMLNPMSTSPREFRADMGVGVARLPAGRNTQSHRQGLGRRSNADTSFHADSMGLAQEAVHEASDLANAARKFASRAAIIDPDSHQAVALERANLG